jgi:hypothetical protein
MITKFKIFENISEQPKIGDFAIVEYEFKNSYTIGTIIAINHDQNFPYRIEIKYTGLESGNFTDVYNMGEIFYWSSNKDELESVLQAKKYNL